MLECDRYPRKRHLATRCDCFNQNGFRCRKKAHYDILVFEDHEREFPRWVLVAACKYHLSSWDKERLAIVP